MSQPEPDVRRDGLRLAGGPVEPVVSAERLSAALADDDVEALRPLMPVGYAAGADAYRQAAAELDAAALTDHYRGGLAWFHDAFVPHLMRRLEGLSGGAWDLRDHVAVAAGSDVDFMTHLVEAVAPREGVSLFPGDWWGFKVGGTWDDRVRFTRDPEGTLAALCVPAVRNGQTTAEMVEWLGRADAALLNINLYPTLAPAERRAVAEALNPVLPKAVLSVSFSRGFGLTASQLGVALVPKDHPYVARFERQWAWHTYFFNALAARAFMAVDLDRLADVDARRRAWAAEWLRARGLPAVARGSYYVQAFRVQGALPDRLAPLARGEVVRLCLKPPIVD